LGSLGTWTLDGKTCILTGATQGIGRAAAVELARLGPRLIVIARDSGRGAALVDELKSRSGNQNIEFIKADLSVQADIRRAAKEFLARHQRLHVLINNAGALFTRRVLSADGLEMTFALNHLGYFLLTNQLLETLQATAAASDNPTKEARIINVASRPWLGLKLHFGDLMHERGYFPFLVYKRSKLANILFTAELARRLASDRREAGRVTANCLHPGFVRSGFGRSDGWLTALAMKLASPFARSPSEGAVTLVHLANSPALSGVSGKYFVDCREAPAGPAARDAVAAQRLWEVSEELVRTASPSI